MYRTLFILTLMIKFILPSNGQDNRPQTEAELAEWTISKVQRIVASTDDVLAEEEPILDTLATEQGLRILKLWMDGDKALKLAVSEPAGKGEAPGQSTFYFSDDEMFYASQPFAKFIFIHGKLQYWLDNQWEPTPASPELLDAREAFLYEEVNKYLGWIYRGGGDE
ncbi:MAG: hypothetical protein KDC66_21110 [Phaeodactylibacter sp.]|nr:hypothetical protein [Phaeodactylibacter sp.]